MLSTCTTLLRLSSRHKKLSDAEYTYSYFLLGTSGKHSVAYDTKRRKPPCPGLHRNVPRKSYCLDNKNIVSWTFQGSSPTIRPPTPQRSFRLLRPIANHNKDPRVTRRIQHAATNPPLKQKVTLHQGNKAARAQAKGLKFQTNLKKQVAKYTCYNHVCSNLPQRRSPITPNARCYSLRKSIKAYFSLPARHLLEETGRHTALPAQLTHDGFPRRPGGADTVRIHPQQQIQPGTKLPSLAGRPLGRLSRPNPRAKRKRRGGRWCRCLSPSDESTTVSSWQCLHIQRT
jgi:hypothetical protein